MNTRTDSPTADLTRIVREITATVAPELRRLTEETALIAAMAGRSKLTDGDGSEILHRAAETKAALFRLEQQLSGALAGQPTAVGNHSRIHDLRSSIKAIRARLEVLGG